MRNYAQILEDVMSAGPQIIASNAHKVVTEWTTDDGKRVQIWMVGIGHHTIPNPDKVRVETLSGEVYDTSDCEQLCLGTRLTRHQGKDVVLDVKTQPSVIQVTFPD